MTSSINRILFNIKAEIKKIPYVLPAKRFVYRKSYVIARGIFKFFRHTFFQPMLRFTLIRELMFDTISSPTLLVSNTKTESFIISSQDQAIGKMLSCHGLLDYEGLERVLSLLGRSEPLDLLIDVGANIGTVCVTAVKRGVAKRAIAIEPGPLNFALLKSNALINNVESKIIMHNVAVGSQDNDQVIFELSDDNFGDHRVRRKLDPGLHQEDKRETLQVRSDTFDTIIGSTSLDNALLWIDTQGYEGYILLGASKAISQQVPIMLEFWPYGMARSGSFNALKDALSRSQYKWFYDLSDPKEKVMLTSAALDEIYEELGETGKFTDLLII